MFARPGLCGMGIGRLGLVAASQPSLVAQALAILAKYGSAANLYLPGVGAINGITAGNWLDSAGTTAATVDNPVGLVVSAGKAVGPELITNGDFSNGSSGWSVPSGWSIASGVCTATSTNASFKQTATPCTAGKFYLVEFDWNRAGGTLYVRVGVGAAATFTTSGRKSAVLVAAGTHGFEAYGGTVSGVLDNISVRELPGAHLTQPTAANRPVLRLSGGVYAWQFDGSNDSFTSTLTTGNEGWVCAGVKFSDANSTFFSSGATAANAGVWLYRNAGGAKSMNMAVANGSAIAYSPDIIPPANTPVVVSGGWTATTVFAGVNEIETSATARSGISASTLPLRIGLATDSSYALNGSMSAAVYCTILPSAADRALIRKLIASLSGVTP